MRFAPFTLAEVEQILRASEGQPGPKGDAIGHAGARHVEIGRNALLDRMYTEGPRKDGIVVKTSFLRFRDQIAATCAALNASASAARLNRFYDPKAPEGDALNLPDIAIRNAVEIDLAEAVRVRVAVGGDGPRTRMASFVTVWGQRMRSRPREMHIISAFATFEPLSIGSLPVPGS